MGLCRVQLIGGYHDGRVVELDTRTNGPCMPFPRVNGEGWGVIGFDLYDRESVNVAVFAKRIVSED